VRFWPARKNSAPHRRTREQDLPYWADPGKAQIGALSHRDGRWGLHFEDLDGHLLEIITRPHGGGI
jgi:hypothetical protein